MIAYRLLNKPLLLNASDKPIYWLIIFLVSNCLSILSQKAIAQNQLNLTAIETQLSPTLLSHLSTIRGDSLLSILAIPIDAKALRQQISKMKTSIKHLERCFGNDCYFVIQGINTSELKQLITTGQCKYLELARQPLEESTQKGLDFSLNQIELLKNEFPYLTGSGMTISIKENRFDSTDIDLLNRYQPSIFSSGASSQHATNMATIVGGAGNSGPTGEGVCPTGSLSSADFSILLPEPANYYETYKISVQNHSYGTGIENYYGIETKAFDDLCQLKPELLHVFSAGNTGEQAASIGQYAGLVGFSNLSGQFKMSKNTITVGATDSFGVILPFSSKGPAYDGRIKPEISAFGQDGSSGAAALVSGLAIIMQQAYANAHQGLLPPSALIRAILANTARDLGNPGLDFEHGFGGVQAFRALHAVMNKYFLLENISNDEIFQTTIEVPQGTASLKVTLAWNDPAADVDAPLAIINDLDLKVENLSSGQTWLPWTLNTLPHPDSLRQAAHRGKDSLNNIEQVSIEAPLAGSYTIYIEGVSNLNNPQQFALTWQIDSLDKFQWVFPLKNAHLPPKGNNLLRWESTMQADAGQLAYRFIGEDWVPFDSATSLTNGFGYWKTPERIGLAQLRFEIGTQQFLSDTFVIAPQLKMMVGFDCPDSLHFFWERLDEANEYQFYHLSGTYLELLAVTTDTFFVQPAAGKSVLHYTVAPVLDEKTGPLSQTIDYTKQGVGCYLKNFLYQYQQGGTAYFTSKIGTTYGLQAAVLEKMTKGSWETVQTISPVSSTNLNFQCSSLEDGANLFRLKFLVNGGAEVVSQIETVYHVQNDNLLLLPNPVASGQPFNLITNNQLSGNYWISDMQGRLVLSDSFDFEKVEVSTDDLPSGCYLVNIVDQNGKLDGKMLIVK